MSTGNRGGPPSSPAPPPRQVPTIAVNSSISSLPYYHPNLTDMKQVKQFLTRYIHVEGSFILRNSISKPGFFTLSVTHSTGIKHFNVEMNSTPIYYLKDIKFETMDQLVKYYSVESVPNKERISNVRLLYPIIRTVPPLPVNPSSQQFTPSSVNPYPEQEDIYIHAVPSELTSKEAQVMAKLRLEDVDKRCDCGLSVEDAMLPRGWSIHLSQHPSSLGEIYFMSPEGRCQWTLPLTVSLELTATQQDLIRDLIYDFETKTNRTARAKSTGSPGNVGLPEAVPPPPSTQDKEFHDVSVWEKASRDANYVQPSPPELLQGVSGTVIIVSKRSTLLPSSPSALKTVSNNEYSTSDDDPHDPDYMKMDRSHLRKD